MLQESKGSPFTSLGVRGGLHESDFVVIQLGKKMIKTIYEGEVFRVRSASFKSDRKPKVLKGSKVHPRKTVRQFEACSEGSLSPKVLGGGKRDTVKPYGPKQKGGGVLFTTLMKKRVSWTSVESS